MGATSDRNAEPALEKAVIYRGPQVPALQAYVPLAVFGVECMLLLLAMRFVGPWALVALPLHIILVLKTNENPYWVRDLLADYRHRWFVANKDVYGASVVTFTPHMDKRRAG